MVGRKSGRDREKRDEERRERKGAKEGRKKERTSRIHLRIETADRPGERTSRRGITGINTSRNYRARGYIPVCIPGVVPRHGGAAEAPELRARAVRPRESLL